MTVKRITIRVSPDLHQQLTRLADDQSKSLNTVAVEALASYAEQLGGRAEHFPLPELSALLAPAAAATDLTEEELLERAREIRRRIWQERYEEIVNAVAEKVVP